MSHAPIKYHDLSIVSNRKAGIDGFTIRHRELGGIVHIYLNDTKLLHVIDKALQDEYGNKKKS